MAAAGPHVARHARAGVGAAVAAGGGSAGAGPPTLAQEIKGCRVRLRRRELCTSARQRWLRRRRTGAPVETGDLCCAFVAQGENLESLDWAREYVSPVG